MPPCRPKAHIIFSASPAFAPTRHRRAITPEHAGHRRRCRCRSDTPDGCRHATALAAIAAILMREASIRSAITFSSDAATVAVISAEPATPRRFFAAEIFLQEFHVTVIFRYGIPLILCTAAS
jgi:hypothetical protein